ncbi:unnamed protein product [Paramecium octaurelia]|uniref:Uncharacterized protein n=1 Tax=Paramecium octaurelia TaxID=43137 RepID=A0A8S1WQK8_PAROT|nr:unnamed protein product [Paramecium octaurelia]
MLIDRMKIIFWFQKGWISSLINLDCDQSIFQDILGQILKELKKNVIYIYNKHIIALDQHMFTTQFLAKIQIHGRLKTIIIQTQEETEYLFQDMRQQLILHNQKIMCPLLLISQLQQIILGASQSVEFFNYVTCLWVFNHLQESLTNFAFQAVIG